MTLEPLALGAWGLSAGVAAAALLAQSARRLTEPDDSDKVRYRSLGTGRWVMGCAALAAGAMTLAALTQPTPALPAWWVLSVVALVLAVIDGRTTYVPLSVVLVGRWSLALAVLLGVAAGGGLSLLVRAAVGAAAAGLFFAAVRQISTRKLALGDVWIAPLVGATAAAGSWSLLYGGLFLGTLAGAAYGVVRRLVRRRQDGFPYAPGLVAGPYLACAVMLVR